jgi:diacylglycerol kinase family enzyme
VVAFGDLLQLLFLIALVAVTGAATRYALGRDIRSLQSGPTPGVTVGPAARPVLLMNPRSGGGKVERFGLVEEARRRGVEPVVLRPGDDLLRLAEDAAARGADVLGMAGGDGSQALVASVAMRYGLAFVCVPAGTRNHLAMDLGLSRDDVVGALDAFGEAVERRIDLGLVGDRVFVNNATVGLYAKIVQSPAYRDHKMGTALALLPGMLGPDAVPFDLRFTGPDGTEHESAHLIMVSNDRYQLDSGDGFGSRRRIDAGTLGIVAARFRSSDDIARFVELASVGQLRRFAGWAEWSDTSFEVQSARPVEIGIDGRRCCWTRRSVSASSLGRCGSASRGARQATRPPPPGPPRPGPPSARCCRWPPAGRWRSTRERREPKELGRPGMQGDATTGTRRGARDDRQVRRRPSGEPPPLPREDNWTRWVWVLAWVVALGGGLNLLIRAAGVVEAADQAVLSWFAEARTPVLTGAAELAVLLTTFAAVMALRLATVVVLVAYRRFRHLVVFLATLVATDWLVVRLLFVELPRPQVPVLVEVDAYAFPSKAVSTLAITLFAMAFVLLPRGRARNRLHAGWVALLALVVLAELYVAGDHLSAMLYAAVLAPSVAAVAFRWLVPEEGFPVTYRKRGSAAHLDLGGERGRAIVRAMDDQLGLTVTEVKAFGLEGSGGSSPLRMTLEDGRRVFGKIYSTSHERADRWYRFGRTILYGQLEDETAVGSVRRLAAYEDYALRLLADHGVRVARTYGLVELTPNQEYMLVTEFFENARNLGDSQVDEVVIDEGLAMVRTFWDAGVAHRDVKPANLLVQDGHLQLVDVSALEVRPSPWRQAVDLSNMLLTLSLRSDPGLVYQRATRVFTPDEVAEALASAVGLTIPTELQAKMKADGRPLLRRLRELAPPRERVSIQRWSTQRLLLTAGAALGTLLLVGLFLDSLRAGLT